MLLRPTLIALSLSIGLSGCIINVNSATAAPKIHEHKSLILDSGSINELVARTGAGELHITGVEDQTQIMLEADIYTYEGLAPTLTLLQRGNQAELVAEFDTSVNFNRSPYIDIKLTVPAQMMLDINDGSGDMSISGTRAGIKLVDGSGDINIEGGAKLNIDDGSGDILISNTQGGITLEDGSGAVNLSNIQGDVSIEDGSGELTVRHVQGLVSIDDGSGDINVTDTQGLTIIEAGSGDLRFDNINGPVSMK